LIETATFSVTRDDFIRLINLLLTNTTAMTPGWVVGSIPFSTESNYNSVNVDDLTSQLASVDCEDNIVVFIGHTTAAITKH